MTMQPVTKQEALNRRAIMKGAVALALLPASTAAALADVTCGSSLRSPRASRSTRRW